MRDEIPPAWRVHLERKAIPATYRGISERADVSHEAVRRVVMGRNVRRSTVRSIADALGVDVETVYELRGQATQAAAMWEPPPASSLLTQDEREALSRLISLMTEDRKKAMGNAQHPAPTTEPVNGRRVTPRTPEPGRKPGSAPSPRQRRGRTGEGRP